MAWTEIILKGILTGLVLTLSFGAGFFALIQTSISKGVKKGLFIALGAMISDMLYILMALFATSFISEELPKYDQLIRILAMISFLFFGLKNIFQFKKKFEDKAIEAEPNFYFLSKGFILNKLNPMILLTWVGISAYLRSSLLYNNLQLLLFFSCVMFSVFATQSLICYSSNKLKKILSDRFIQGMNIGVGILFIFLGIFIFLYGGSAESGIEKARDMIGK
jgi:threonine/homoserine/homoserine lactone efflux protein